uniref:Uncharacterized protein n=1 Tax=Anguilla anguilla TaxID=7936 RepID=A0A0E9QBB1_ANGAN
MFLWRTVVPPHARNVVPKLLGRRINPSGLGSFKRCAGHNEERTTFD